MPVIPGGRLLKKFGGHVGHGGGAFDAGKHPRSHGKFASKGGGDVAAAMGHVQSGTPQSAVPSAEADRHDAMLAGHVASLKSARLTDMEEFNAASAKLSGLSKGQLDSVVHQYTGVKFKTKNKVDAMTRIGNKFIDSAQYDSRKKTIDRIYGKH